MATSEELNAVAGRLRANNYGLSRHDASDREADQATLADAYLAHITEQERIAVERALPITEEWWASIEMPVFRFSSVSQCPCCIVGRYAFWFHWNGHVMARIDGEHQSVFAELENRGEVLDLLSALKIKPSLDAN